MKSFKILFTFAFVLCFGMSYGQSATLQVLSNQIEVTKDADPKIRITENAGASMELLDNSPTQCRINKFTTGPALIDINPIPPSSSNANFAKFRFFRQTNTTGDVTFEVHYGDGTSGHNCRIAGNTDSYLNKDFGNVGIGKSGPTEKLDVNGNIKANNVMFQDPNSPERYVTITDVVSEQNAVLQSLKEELNELTSALEEVREENAQLKEQLSLLSSN